MSARKIVAGELYAMPAGQLFKVESVSMEEFDDAESREIVWGIRWLESGHQYDSWCYPDQLLRVALPIERTQLKEKLSAC